jgi:hypothetical protein
MLTPENSIEHVKAPVHAIIQDLGGDISHLNEDPYNQDEMVMLTLSRENP